MPQGDPYTYIREMIDLGRRAAGDPALDDVHTAEVEKVTTLLQNMLAELQKDSEGLMQGKMNPRAMSRAMDNIQAGNSPMGGPAPGGPAPGGPSY